MKNKLDDILRMMAFVCLLVFAVMGAAGACEGNTEAAWAYVCAAAWVVIYLVMEEE